MKTYLVAFFALTAFFLGSPSRSFAQDWLQIDQGSRPSVLYIEALRRKRDGTNPVISSASGFVVGCRGYAVTVAHAVPPAASDEEAFYSISVMTKTAHKYPVDVIWRDLTLDIALIQLPQLAQPWPRLDIGNSAGVPEGSRLYALGFPLNQDLSSVEGVLSSKSPGPGSGGKWQTTLPLNPGSSGGPVFSTNGQVVGVAASGFSQAQNVTFIIPSNLLGPLRSMLPTEDCQGTAIAATSVPQLPRGFVYATGFFERAGNIWVERPASDVGGYTFQFVEQGVVDGYLYLVDRSRVKDGDRGRPFTLRIPVAGGMSQWSFPNPFQWQDLYVVRAER